MIVLNMLLARRILSIQGSDNFMLLLFDRGTIGRVSVRSLQAAAKGRRPGERQ